MATSRYWSEQQQLSRHCNLFVTVFACGASTSKWHKRLGQLVTVMWLQHVKAVNVVSGYNLDSTRLRLEIVVTL